MVPAGGGWAFALLGALGQEGLRQLFGGREKIQCVPAHAVEVLECPAVNYTLIAEAAAEVTVDCHLKVYVTASVTIGFGGGSLVTALACWCCGYGAAPRRRKGGGVVVYS